MRHLNAQHDYHYIIRSPHVDHRRAMRISRSLGESIADDAIVGLELIN